MFYAGFELEVRPPGAPTPRHGRDQHVLKMNIEAARRSAKFVLKLASDVLVTKGELVLAPLYTFIVRQFPHSSDSAHYGLATRPPAPRGCRNLASYAGMRP